MGGGAGDMSAALQQQSSASIQTANIQAGSEEKMATTQASQATLQARIQQETEIKTATMNADVKMAELRVREKEAKYDFRVAWKEADNARIQAEASYISAQANVIKAEAKQFDAETKRERNSRNYNAYPDYLYERPTYS